MRYVFDNDMHIHSGLSLCSARPDQNPERILQYARENNLKTVVLTDHYWDKAVPIGKMEFYNVQDYDYIAKALPLPTAEGVDFLFGCETDLDKDGNLGIPPERYDDFAFIVIPTTHLHMSGFTCRGDENGDERAQLWIKKFDQVLDMDLPFHKVGIAHLTCSLMHSGQHFKTLSLIPDEELHRLFARAAKCGVGIELNFPIENYTPEEAEIELRIYRVAKEEGCKFYFASDAHSPEGLNAEKARAELIIDMLKLTEDDKFILRK